MKYGYSTLFESTEIRSDLSVFKIVTIASVAAENPQQNSTAQLKLDIKVTFKKTALSAVTWKCLLQ